MNSKAQTNEDVLEQIKRHLPNLTDNRELVRGITLMAYATQTDVHSPNKLYRSESFAYHIVATLVKNILRINASDNDLLRSDVVRYAIGMVLAVTDELAENGYLIEESVLHDACPHMRVNDKPFAK